MAKRLWIVIGDKTSHGGTVKTGSGHFRINGKGVAREGDVVSCPECGGDYEIVTGAENPTVRNNGKRIAREGDVTLVTGFRFTGVTPKHKTLLFGN